MPIFRLADDPNAQQRLGDAVGHLPVEVEREGEKIVRVGAMPDWASFVFALVQLPEETFLITDPATASGVRDFVAQHAPGAVVEE